MRASKGPPSSRLIGSTGPDSFDKVVASLGGSLFIGKHWRFDAVWAHLFASTVTVSPDTAAIPRVNPINGNATFEAVNGGTYSASADLIGVGLNYVF